ncbi:c6 transcription [Moniliophthora roreri]|nr:c6 transcription [Moniliophthora roreri]
MSKTGAANTFKFEGVIRFHTKSRSGCLTCRRRIKCDETKPICRRCYQRNIECVQRSKNEHGQERRQQQQETVLYKPLTAPTPIPMGITSLQIIHHFTTVTSASFDSEPGNIILVRTMPQLSWDNPYLFHALLSCAALHLGRLYSEEPRWVYLASAHQKAAIDALPGATNLDAKFLTIGLFTMYTISSSLSSSLKNIFSLMTSLHNVLSTLEGLTTFTRHSPVTHAKPNDMVGSEVLKTEGASESGLGGGMGLNYPRGVKFQEITPILFIGGHW